MSCGVVLIHLLNKLLSARWKQNLCFGKSGEHTVSSQIDEVGAGGISSWKMLFRGKGRKKKGEKPLSLENSPTSVSSRPLHTFIFKLYLYVARAVLYLLFGLSSPGMIQFPLRFLVLFLELCFMVDLKDILKSRMNKKSTQANHRLVCLK